MYLLGGFDRHIIHNLGFPVYNDFNNIFELPNVVIDFSAPESTINFLNFAKSKKIALVIATTGFNQEQKDQILEASDEIPIFLSANMSYEISLMKDIVSNLSQKLPNSEIEIIETHHSEKLIVQAGPHCQLQMQSSLQIIINIFINSIECKSMKKEIQMKLDFLVFVAETLLVNIVLCFLMKMNALKLNIQHIHVVFLLKVH